jgi:hypothetical protein
VNGRPDSSASRRLGFFRTLFALCASFQNYRAIRDVPVTSSLRFIGQLLAVLTLVFVLASVPRARGFVERVALQLDHRRPDFSLQDGKIVTTAPQPYIWGDHTLRFVLDTAGQLPSPLSNAQHCAVFTSNSIVYWMTISNGVQPVVSSHETKLAGFPDGPVNGEYVRSVARTFLWVLVPFSWMFLTLGAMLVCLLQAYVFSLVASLLERGLPHGLQLPQLLNIAIHAVAPAAIILTAYKAMWLEGVDLWLIYLIAYGVFLVGASHACRDRESQA